MGNDVAAHVFDEVRRECTAAWQKFGPQTAVPDGTGADWQKHEADIARMTCQSAFAAGDGSWMAILHEEVAEAFAESDPTLLRAELLQVAAVALRWVEAIEARTWLEQLDAERQS